MSELNTMWAVIHQALPYIRTAINDSAPPPDGMPGTPSNPRRLPCNEHALSLEEVITRRATYWSGEQDGTQWLAGNAGTLMDNLGPEDQLNFQTETHSLHQEAQQYQPSHIRARHLTGKDITNIYCDTLASIKQHLDAITGTPTKLPTLRQWKQRGHLPKTGRGYSLATALERTSAHA